MIGIDDKFVCDNSSLKHLQVTPVGLWRVIEVIVPNDCAQFTVAGGTLYYAAFDAKIDLRHEAWPAQNGAQLGQCWRFEAELTWASCFKQRRKLSNVVWGQCSKFHGVPLFAQLAGGVEYHGRMTRFKDPLTREALVAIQARHPRVPGNQHSDDLYAALWEIQRLRALVLRADQLQRAFGDSVVGGGLTLVLEAFRADLAREPCLLEQRTLPELSAGPRMKQSRENKRGPG